MSEIADYLRSVVESYIDREIDTDAFRERFVGTYVHVRNASGDTEANKLADRLMLPYAEFSAGHRSEDSLRSELANAIRYATAERRET